MFLRLSSTVVVVSLLAAHAGDARADGDASVQAKPSFWKSGPAGGAFGFFVEGGVTGGQFDFDTFGAASLALGVSLRWFEASVLGFGGSSFDGNYSGGAFLARVALRLPLKYVAFTLGQGLGYVEVPGHYVSGVVFEPLEVGFEVDPVCHLRIGVLGAWAPAFSTDFEGVARVAFTVGYVMGACSKP
jgi:hypothetical protein